MPTLEWNRIWAKNFKTFSRGKLSNQREHYGDQWGVPGDVPYLTTVRDVYLKPFVNAGHTALEIGSGGGRWTNYMQGFAKVYCVDLNPEMLGYLKTRFKGVQQFEYVLTNGTDFPGVPPKSVDFAFSYDVFVHLDLDLIEGYLKSLNHVLKPGATCVVHFSDCEKPAARANPGFSNNDVKRMSALLQKHNFTPDKIESGMFPHSALIECRYRSRAELPGDK